LVDVRVSVGEDGTMVMRFEGVNGNPIVSGIGLKRGAKLPGIFTSSTLTCYIKPM
jgi:kinesin family protein C2/C3